MNQWCHFADHAVPQDAATGVMEVQLPAQFLALTVCALIL
jgi:hypothetical protein